ANRLASNSLLEALVFGARTANAMRQESLGGPPPKLSPSTSLRDEFANDAATQIRDTTWRCAGIVRNEERLKQGLAILNTLPENLNVRNLLSVARIIHESALARTESRGAHYRDDFPSLGPV